MVYSCFKEVFYNVINAIINFVLRLVDQWIEKKLLLSSKVDNNIIDFIDFAYIAIFLIEFRLESSKLS